MTGANFTGGRRNAAKFRAKDSIHRNHFGRQKRSNLGTVSLGFGVHPLMTTASRGLQEISLGHTKLDIELQPEKPDCFRVVSSPTSSHRSLVSMVPAIAPKRSQILPLLDEANPVGYRAKIDRLLKIPDFAGLESRPSRKINQMEAHISESIAHGKQPSRFSDSSATTSSILIETSPTVPRTVHKIGPSVAHIPPKAAIRSPLAIDDSPTAAALASPQATGRKRKSSEKENHPPHLEDQRPSKRMKMFSSAPLSTRRSRSTAGPRTPFTPAASSSPQSSSISDFSDDFPSNRRERSLSRQPLRDVTPILIPSQSSTFSALGSHDPNPFLATPPRWNGSDSFSNARGGHGSQASSTSHSHSHSNKSRRTALQDLFRSLPPSSELPTSEHDRNLSNEPKLSSPSRSTAHFIQFDEDPYIRAVRKLKLGLPVPEEICDSPFGFRDESLELRYGLGYHGPRIQDSPFFDEAKDMGLNAEEENPEEPWMQTPERQNEDIMGNNEPDLVSFAEEAGLTLSQLQKLTSELEILSSPIPQPPSAHEEESVPGAFDWLALLDDDIQMEDGEAIYESPTQGLRKIQGEEGEGEGDDAAGNDVSQETTDDIGLEIEPDDFQTQLASIKGTIRLETGPPITYDSPSRVSPHSPALEPDCFRTTSPPLYSEKDRHSSASLRSKVSTRSVNSHHESPNPPPASPAVEMKAATTTDDVVFLGSALFDDFEDFPF